ncbi:MAG: hypothetical protein MH472_02815 [Bacteroidia bacterium]|nr:hypothetical protein [Bacteroidia bacterium]
MTRLKTVFFLTFIFLNSLCWGQKTIKGTFVYSEGFVYESLTLTKNNKYSYISAKSCTSNSFDSGIYKITKDTIFFHSTINVKEFENRKDFTIGLFNSLLENNEYVDSLTFIISNYNSFQIENINIFNNDTLIHVIERIDSNSENNIFKIPINKNANSINLTLKIGDKLEEVIKTNMVEVSFNWYSGDTFEAIPWSWLILKRDKVFPSRTYIDFYLKRQK